VLGRKAFVGRTGYTGEDGFEIVSDARDGAALWEALNDGGMAACGLGARDVLRLEAGLPLHGSDIDLTTTPLEAGLGRFVRLKKEFAGAEALRSQKEAGVERALVGLFSEGRSIPRHDYDILAEGKSVGRITSGSYSPTLDRNIAIGYVQTRLSEEGQSLQVDIRGRPTAASVTTLPFYKRK
jgi:aminomethyltransferase